MDALKYRQPAPPTVYPTPRPDDPRIGEAIQPVDAVPRLSGPGRKTSQHSIVLWGCPDDTGVRHNRGRPGAAGGPNHIRTHLFKMTPGWTEWEKSGQLYDLGNLIPGPDILKTQRRAQALCQALIEAGHTVIALGGGHDFGAPHFLGLAAGKKTMNAGLINVDPHLDVRPLEKGGLPHSGSPFRQCLESGKLSGKRFVEFGARANRNSRALRDYCRKQKVRVLEYETLRRKPKPLEHQYRTELNRLARSSDWVSATFDMDACSDAEGTSAAPVLGFSAWELVEMARFAGEQKKVALFEMVEVAPTLDFQDRCSRIAAEMAFAFILARLGSHQKK